MTRPRTARHEHPAHLRRDRRWPAGLAEGRAATLPRRIRFHTEHLRGDGAWQCGVTGWPPPRLDAEVVVVLSNVEDAIILERARAHGVQAVVHIPSKGMRGLCCMLPCHSRPP